jgi:hypothetical protein
MAVSVLAGDELRRWEAFLAVHRKPDNERTPDEARRYDATVRAFDLGDSRLSEGMHAAYRRLRCEREDDRKLPTSRILECLAGEIELMGSGLRWTVEMAQGLRELAERVPSNQWEAVLWLNDRVIEESEAGHDHIGAAVAQAAVAIMNYPAEAE